MILAEKQSMISFEFTLVSVALNWSVKGRINHSLIRQEKELKHENTHN
ncbi:hypothetical protein THERMOT_376 [Bathymodiolus thermophilus thioautotrophic gill symbiont]|uniref:Uncharacterized protein n=1 Tax=Bathymodiolus thermophilus thioautotrophic gill symbiont TaxID=2360 RepID=A0A3G3IM76_9GAMM|nr:hypothetical protein MS2017_1263 [Bathymodiolus thermophilus thioautotrophic gill symbiont]CAB5495780.1 hypothetical protein THERMOT_376 [Bathymodiolus thermophilus thioautotrophic gill symbiont]CAB5505204.1 hypothetical protein THERMOS_2085 [Bathymodiolus thermophilus thioautotrophic gill symbiont]